MAIPSKANLTTIINMMFENRDKPDSPLSEADLVDAVAVPVTLFTATTAQLGAATDVINTTDKFAGKLVMDTTTNILNQAQGAGATDAWQPVTGAAAVVPA